MIAALGIALVAVRPLLRKAGHTAGVRDTPHIRAAPVGEFLGTAFIGGFRAVAVDAAWVRATRLQEQQKWYELLVLLDLIASLQPRQETVWEYNAWNMAFNISVAVSDDSPETTDDDERAWQWVKRSMAYLARGCRRNPKSYRLRRVLGQMYFERFGGINNFQSRYYARRLREETGRSNWEWSIDWIKQAIAVSDEVRPFHRNYIPLSLDHLAREAVARGDLAEMRLLRLQALEWWERIVHRFPWYGPGKERIKETKARLQAYDLAEQAEHSLQQHKYDRWLKLAAEVTTIWEHLLQDAPWNEETIRNLKAMATALSAVAQTLQEAGRTTDAQGCRQESERLWQLLAEKTTDEEAAERIRRD